MGSTPQVMLACDPSGEDLRELGVVLRVAGFGVVATAGFREALDGTAAHHHTRRVELKLPWRGYAR
jgi:hypothetical protein